MGNGSIPESKGTNDKSVNGSLPEGKGTNAESGNGSIPKSQAQAAAIVGVDESTVRKWEKGTIRKSPDGSIPEPTDNRGKTGGCRRRIETMRYFPFVVVAVMFAAALFIAVALAS